MFDKEAINRDFPAGVIIPGNSPLEEPYHKLGDARILLVDDQEHIRTLYRMELEDEGYTVVAIPSGFRILERIEQENPDIIVLDIRLMDVDGLDVLQKIKERYIHIPVGLCTAYEPFKYDMKNITADFYVIKSHDLTKLKRNIASTLERYWQKGKIAS